MDFVFANGGPAIGYLLGYIKIGELLFGNLFIGIAESLILKYILKVNNRWWVIVIANYVSAFLTMYLFSFTFLGGFQLANPKEFTLSELLIAYFVSFLLTLFIEGWFYWLAFKYKPNRKKLLLSILLPNLITYSIITSLYLMLSLGSDWTY